MIGKRLINTGVAAADALVPSEHFNTVLYTGNGSTQRIGGYINRGGVFNGSSSKIVTSLNNSDIESFSFWFYFESGTTVGRALGSNVSSSGGDLSVEIATNGTIVCQLQNLQYATNTGALGSTGWKHIYYDTNRDLYINGTLNSSGTDSTTSFPSSTALIGALRTNYGFINTKIDQVRFFNKTLSSSEVTTLYGETHASTTISTTDIFSDNSGVALYQLDGNANDTGGVSGKFGSAAIFNGNGRIDTNTVFTSMVGSSTSYSISAWIYPTSNTTARPFGTENSTDGFLIQTSNGNIKAGGGNGSYNFTSDYTCAINQWHHICLVITTNSSIKLYVDNVLKETLSTTISFSGSARLFLGADYNTASGENPFTGKIDDVRIYSDVLTSTEVGYLYNNTTASIPTDNLVAYYKLDGDARDEQQLYDGTATNVTYAYDGTATNVTYQEATNFQPDLVWIKNRDIVVDHALIDSVRGATEVIRSNQTTANTTRTDSLTSFDSNGFTLGSDGVWWVNKSGDDFVAWCFKGGGADVLNENGSINSQVSANTDAGFSIVSYAGNNGSSATIGHGLNSAPELVIIKARNLAAGWPTLAAPNGTIVYTRRLNDTGATDSSLGSVFFNSTAPTSSVFTVGGSDEVNDGYNYIAYCFHSVDGYSKIGSYTGTGAENSIVTGFEPQFVMIKRTDSTGDWFIYDNERDTENPRAVGLYANLSLAEFDTNSSDGYLDVYFYSNGFTLDATYAGANASGGTYIYLAIAADPDTTTPTVENSFDVVTYTGDGTTSQIIDVDFKPYLVWVKARGLAQAPNIFDSIRGGELMRTSLTSASAGDYIDYIDDGFQFKVTDAGWNQSSQNYVAWCWKAGDHDDNLPQINTEGSIDSVVSVNAEAGFSIVKYRGTASVGATVGHGLSSTPELYIIKETSAADDWMVVAKIGSSYQRGKLQTTDAFSTAMSGVTNNVDPTSTVITLGNSGSVNQSGQDYIGYFFHSVSGYQKIGSYTGQTGSVSVTTGFQPRFVLIKKTNTSTNGDWSIFDSNRMTSTTEGQLLPNRNYAESTRTGLIDFDSNGFTINNNTVGQINTNGDSYIYLAIK
jgi:hypothetical protein